MSDKRSKKKDFSPEQEAAETKTAKPAEAGNSTQVPDASPVGAGSADAARAKVVPGFPLRASKGTAQTVRSGGTPQTVRFAKGAVS